MTFTMQCPSPRPHEPHYHDKTWRKKALPFLRESDTYPEEWTATYHCRGVGADLPADVSDHSYSDGADHA